MELNGLVLIDKPGGCTSHDVVQRWRKLAQTKRVGHLGTLDPMATGLLALLTGSATRLAQYFGRDEKTYEAQIRLGQVSDTYDAEGEIVSGEVAPELLPGEEAIRAALDSFRGVTLQTPPPVSAKKVNGVRAYALARQKKPVELTPVEVNVAELRTVRVAPPFIDLVITVSAGTYIRSIAHDLGRMLGCGGLLQRLRRTRVGRYCVEDARTLDQLSDLGSRHMLQQAVIPAQELLPDIPAETVNDIVECHIRQGRDFRTSPFVVPPGSPLVKAVSSTGILIGVGELKIPNVYHPCTVL